MRQDAWMLLVLRVVLVAGVTSVAGFAAQYQHLTRGRWRDDPIGVTIMAEALILLGVLGLTVPGVFFRLTRFDARAAAWAQIGLLALLAVVMAWRTVVFQREKNGPRNRKDDRDKDDRDDGT